MSTAEMLEHLPPGFDDEVFEILCAIEDTPHSTRTLAFFAAKRWGGKRIPARIMVKSLPEDITVVSTERKGLERHFALCCKQAGIRTRKITPSWKTQGSHAEELAIHNAIKNVSAVAIFHNDDYRSAEIAKIAHHHKRHVSAFDIRSKPDPAFVYAASDKLEAFGLNAEPPPERPPSRFKSRPPPQLHR